jgi:serine/threonine protein phosphatase PrpC
MLVPLLAQLIACLLRSLTFAACAAAAAVCLDVGSSTACVLVVNGTTLSASNLGDSGFVLVRDGVATFQCPQQQHNFNFPFQLGSADSMSDQPQAAMVRGRWGVKG